MHLATDPAPISSAGSMLTAAREFWLLAPEELDTLLALACQADRVELKVVVPEAAHTSTCAALGVDLSGAPARHVHFLDTPDLALERHGVVARIRSGEDGHGDSVIKLRPVVPRELPGRVRRSKRFTVEVDAMPAHVVCTAAMKRRLALRDVELAMTRDRPLRTLFSRDQLALLAAYTPAGVGVDDLTVLGPVHVRRGSIVPDGLGRVLTVEQWAYPDGFAMVELSTRCTAAEVVPVAARMASLMRGHHIEVAVPQQTKTRVTLAYFAARATATASRAI